MLRCIWKINMTLKQQAYNELRAVLLSDTILMVTGTENKNKHYKRFTESIQRNQKGRVCSMYILSWPLAWCLCEGSISGQSEGNVLETPSTCRGVYSLIVPSKELSFLKVGRITNFFDRKMLAGEQTLLPEPIAFSLTRFKLSSTRKVGSILSN